MDNFIKEVLVMRGVKPLRAKAKSATQKAQKLKEELVKKMYKIMGGSQAVQYKNPRALHGAGRKKQSKKKLSPYNKFVKKLRLQGYTMKEIGKMWRKMKN